MNYLLDTNVVAELMKAAPNPGVIDWVNEHDASEEARRGDFRTYRTVIAVAMIKRWHLKQWESSFDPE